MVNLKLKYFCPRLLRLKVTDYKTHGDETAKPKQKLIIITIV